MLSSHLVDTPIDADRIKSLANRDEQLYFLVNTDGTLAVYSSQKIQELRGWVLWSTDGVIESVACTTDFVYISVKRTINSATVYYLEQFASTSFDIPTDMSITKTLSASYQPHGTPLTNGTTSSSTGFIADGFTNAPQVGEKFKFAGTGTEYTINSVNATGNSGEYNIVVNVAVSTSNNVELRFTFSKTWSGLNSSPDMRGLKVYGTSGSTEGGTINYYGDGTVSSGGVVVLDSVASAIDIGIDYTTQIKTLPVNAKVTSTGTQSPLVGNPTKIGRCILEVSSTFNLKVNTMDVIINTTTIDTSSGISSFTGKKDVFFLGYNNEPAIDITQSAPLPLRILGITSEVYF